MTKTEVIKRTRDLPRSLRAGVVCALIGHSDIVTTCWGYVYCARCQAQVGDTLGGAATLKDKVIVGHKCKECRATYAKMDWRHRYLVPDPFKKMKEVGN